MQLLIAVIVIASSSYIFYRANASAKKYSLNNFVLTNIEACANDESSGEKKYRYVTWQGEDCYVYVGGAYAKGKKVSCHSGKEHPVCVDCSL